MRATCVNALMCFEKAENLLRIKAAISISGHRKWERREEYPAESQLLAWLQHL